MKSAVWSRAAMIVLFGTLLGLAGIWTETPAAEDRIGLGKGFRPPAFTAADLDGTTHRLSAYEGRVVVLHFWASWCPYCRREIPELQELHEQWRAKGVQVLSVSVDEDLAALKRFVSAHRLVYPVIADLALEASLAEQYGIAGIPVTYVIAADGRIAARLPGSAEIIQAVQRALNQRSTPS